MTVLINFGLLCGAIIAILTMTSLVAKLPPIQWLWRTLISIPLSQWGSSLIKEGALQFHEETVRPQIDVLSQKVDSLIVLSETSWTKDKAWIVGRLTTLEVRQDITERRQQAIITGVTSTLGNGPMTPLELQQGVLTALRDAITGSESPGGLPGTVVEETGGGDPTRRD